MKRKENTVDAFPELASTNISEAVYEVWEILFLKIDIRLQIGKTPIEDRASSKATNAMAKA